MLISMVAATAALLLLAVAVVFLAGALYLWLRTASMPPALAALVVGFVGLALAGLVVLGTRFASGGDYPPRFGRPQGAAGALGRADATEALASELGGLAARELVIYARAHPYHATSAAFLAGVTLGGSPDLRDIVATAVKSRNGCLRAK